MTGCVSWSRRSHAPKWLQALQVKDPTLQNKCGMWGQTHQLPSAPSMRLSAAIRGFPEPIKICTGHGWQVGTAMLVRTLASGLPSLTTFQHSSIPDPRYIPYLIFSAVRLYASMSMRSWLFLAFHISESSSIGFFP